jgi:hypothetical protein
MEDQENFAHNVRVAGQHIETAEYELAVADAEEKKIIAQVMIQAELAAGCKTNAAQLRAADENPQVFEVRLARGKAKGKLAAAKSNLVAAEMEFKLWQSNMATTRFDKRIYNS